MPNSFLVKLQSLPLFQGMSVYDLMEICENIRFDFRKQPSGTTFIEQDTLCDRLVFITEGSYSICHESDDRCWHICEKMSRPAVFQPHRLFGLRTQFSFSVRSDEPLSLIIISKDAVRDLLLTYPTFRLNFMNHICCAAQQSERVASRKVATDLRRRFVQFAVRHCTTPAGEKQIKIRMTTLAEELQTTRLNVSRMLSDLRSSGLVATSRGKIIIPDLSLL